ncbi:MAG: hypothetical protein ACRYG5_16785 [Janthinobacterium lividum]
MKRLLSFDPRGGPWVARTLYVLLSLLMISSSIINLMRGDYVTGLVILVFGLLLVRLLAELVIAVFRVEASLQSIQQMLAAQADNSSKPSSVPLTGTRDLVLTPSTTAPDTTLSAAGQP